MKSEELARENRGHFLVTLSKCILEPAFLDVVQGAYAIAKEARRRGDEGLLEESCQCMWGYDCISITAEAAEYWIQSGLKPSEVSERLKSGIRGTYNNCAVIEGTDGKKLTFIIENYSTRDSSLGLLLVSDPLSWPSGTDLDRHVIIHLE